MSIPLLFADQGSTPPVVAQRLVLPITGNVTLQYPWGTEIANAPRGVVDESSRIIGTVGQVP